MKYKVKDKTEIRSEPSLERGRAYGVLESDFIVDIVQEVHVSNSNDIWLKDANGFFYRKGAMEKPLLTIPSEQVQLDLRLKAPWLSGNFDISSIWPKTTGNGISVAIIDSGIFEHEDLSDNIDRDNQKAFIGGSVIDNDGHGTHIAGIIGAKGIKELIGVAPNVKLIPIKVVERANEKIDNLRISDAVEYATSIPAVQVINLSLKANHRRNNYSKLKSSIQKAISKGVIIVSASGNDWGNFVASPANVENVIAVSALKQLPSNIEQYQIPLFANYGKKVDTACIGHEIISCGINGQSTSVKSGTSMASAYISGLIALKLRLLIDKGLDYKEMAIIDDLKNAVFGYAKRKNEENISLPIIHPIKFLTT